MLRLIGRRDDLRKRLFQRSLDVRLCAPIDNPDAVLGAAPEAQRWEEPVVRSQREKRPFGNKEEINKCPQH
jgi:hypothetical protein